MSSGECESARTVGIKRDQRIKVILIVLCKGYMLIFTAYLDKTKDFKMTYTQQSICDSSHRRFVTTPSPFLVLALKNVDIDGLKPNAEVAHSISLTCILLHPAILFYS